MPKKKPKKPDKTVLDVLYDWENKEILLTHQVYSRHIAEAAHDEAYEYYETLKPIYQNQNLSSSAKPINTHALSI